jgi:hypothetical protein
MKIKKIIIIPIIIISILAIWLGIAYSDYCQVGINWTTPNLCILTNGAQDGGSGNYIGLGYSFDIKGNLDVNKGYQVEEYTFKVLGITIKEDSLNH